MLVFVVLIQSSKGSQIGAAFGGSSQTIFGSRGAATFLAKFTTAAAIIFMLTSMLLTIMEVKRVSIVKPDSQTTSTNKKIPPVKDDKRGVDTNPGAATQMPVVPPVAPIDKQPVNK